MGEVAWRGFLERWSAEWADAWDPEQSPGERDREALRERWLGSPGADEARMAAVEERLGCRLPPSYRAFLEVSDGWRHAGGFVSVLAGTGEIRWSEDVAGLGQALREELDEDSPREEVLAAAVWERALRLDVESDATYVVMGPDDVDAAGEWAVYVWAGWRAAPPERYGSFREFMEAMHREFHCLESGRSGASFVNDTTREQDAAVEEARLAALSGRYERAEAALEEALAYGRPRARGLYDQIRRLTGHTYAADFDRLAFDPVYAPELLAVLAADHVRDSWKDDAAWTGLFRGAGEAVRELGGSLLGQVRDGTYRYTAEGPFGRAVEEAREQARWGRTDEAWRILRAALPLWRPLGPEHLAPVGLLADPFLGQVCGIPERGRELLATPRAGETGDVPVPAADVDPPGLAWLADADDGELGAGYRFVLVEGVRPDELPELLGAEGVSGLRGPQSRFEALFRAGRGAGPGAAEASEATEAGHWEDRAVAAAVGLAGEGWSFVFDGRPQPFNAQRFVSPAVVASGGAFDEGSASVGGGGAVAGGRGGRRAVVVWSSPAARPGRPGVFHLSVARGGEERYAFTVRGGETTERRGAVPEPLDPDRFFGRGGTGEAGLLDAVAGEFGVGLPRFALTRGRAYTLTTRSWTRPPEPGEPMAVLRFVRSRGSARDA
ncbi:SMI1/KNR4 family protein [Streptomyces sp. NPDC001381]|uniref:SMI1/KNR4 family protein n=1 Tax=Streptomyces sp. NPDC001381 TaxID=3364567 RepID=UPI0036A7CD3D